MKRVTLRILVAASTFLVGVAVTSVWLISSVSEYEEPPCRACADIYASSEIPTVTLCEVANNPERYRDQTVRVLAQLNHDAGYIFLSDRACGDGGHVRAGFMEFSGSCSGARKLLSRYSGYETWYDASASVVVVGRFGQVVNYYHGEDGFNIMCLEKAGAPEMSPAKKVFYEVASRAYFTIGRVGKFVFDRI